MAPEQVRGEAVDRADIFALGAVLYEMLTGKRAFARSTSAETMTAVLQDDPPAIRRSSRLSPRPATGGATLPGEKAGTALPIFFGSCFCPRGTVGFRQHPGSYHGPKFSSALVLASGYGSSGGRRSTRNCLVAHSAPGSGGGGHRSQDCVLRILSSLITNS